MELPGSNYAEVGFQQSVGGASDALGFDSFLFNAFQWCVIGGIFTLSRYSAGGPNITLFVLVSSRGPFVPPQT
jgi:hypothetical protein